MDQTTSTHRSISSELETTINTLIEATYIQHRVSLIQGIEGTGKQRIVDQLAHSFQGKIHFIKVSCTQLSSNVPYYAYRMVVQALIQELLLSERLELLQKVYDKFIKSHSLEIFTNLESFIPELKGVISKKTEDSKTQQQPTRENSLEYFRKFMELCFQEAEKPVVLVFEKIEWLDSSSSFFLKSLFKEWNSGKALFIFLSSLNENEGHSNNFLNIVKAHSSATFLISIISKTDFEKALEVKLAPNIVSKSVRNELYRLTGGNIQYLSSILSWLESKRLIWLLDGLWCTDIFALRKHLKPQSAESLLKDQLKRLSALELSILNHIVIAQECDIELLCHLLALSNSQLQQELLSLVEKQFINLNDQGEFELEELYRTKLLYELIPAPERNKTHFKIGFSVLQEAKERHRIFSAVHHLNRGSQYALKNNKHELLAKANLKAGEQALKSGIFQEGRHYFRMAEMHLNFDGSLQKYKLYYQIITQRAQLEYLLKNYDYANLRLDDLLVPHYPLEDRINVYVKKIKLNNHLGRYTTARDVLLDGLSALGFKNFFETAPQKIKRLQTDIDSKVKLFLASLDHDDLDEMPSHFVHKNTLLYNAGIAIHHTSEEEMLLSNLSIITDGLKYKKTGELAVACCVYGRFLFTQQQDIERAISFGQLGLKIAESLENKLYLARAYGIFTFYTLPWKRTLHENLKYLDQGASIAKKEKDFYLQSILQTHAYTLQVLLGNHLEDVTDLGEQLSNQNSPIAYSVSALNHLIKFLSGKLNSLPKAYQSIHSTTVYSKNETLFFQSFSKGVGLFTIGLYAFAAIEFEKAYAHSVLQRGSILYNINLMFLGISLAEHQNSNHKEEYLLQLISELERYEKETSTSSQIFTFSTLLKAVFYSSKNENATAEFFFDRFVNNQNTPQGFKALGYELKFNHQLKNQKEDKSTLEKAIENYKLWGADYKANTLNQAYRKFRKDSEYKQLDTFKVYLEFQNLLEELSSIEEVSSFALKYLFLLSSANNGSVYLYQKDHFILINKAHNFPFNCFTYSPEMNVKGQAYQLNIAYQTKIEQQIISHKSTDHLKVPTTLHNFYSIPMNSGDFIGTILLENLDEQLNEDLENQLQLFTRLISSKIRQILSSEKERFLNQQLIEEVKKKDLLNQEIKAQNKTWLKATIEGQEKERLRIAQDLHDSVGAMLGAVKLNIQNVIEPESDTQRISPILEQIDEVCQDIRRISHNMLPSALTRFGLSVSLEKLIDQYETLDKFEIDFSIMGLNETPLSQDIEISVFRIIQEALQNIQKYAGCTEVCIQLIARDDALSIFISDDGCGFDTNTTAKGIGLLNIESRIISLDGTWTLDSTQGRGTEINIEIPLNKLT
ncbi:AAA family ATPase [Sediminitomix flava]|uniref:Histidine kinase/DNA gyrase B/HSP90-like ATPase n=1 Tax=Sediminitomix flava TaxID=379075 RepID=A0A315ZGV8_SEDFL|nr:AAA family ATPase [Sediminitomix flava]PWJ44399.1 histidine kinase/DNA gyrase B/HSP90-like ATPase [Sediminitomix flava]